MMLKTSLIGYVLLFLFRLINSDRQVTFTCDGSGGPEVKGEPGAPGKRGPQGLPGMTGPKGQKGTSVDVTALENQIKMLNKSLMMLRRELNDRTVPVTNHHRIPAAQVTWTMSNTFCESRSMVLCSRNRIFRNNIPVIGVQSGDHWVPIREQYNGWVQIGDFLSRTGTLHTPPPTWGERKNFSPRYKGHIFCCNTCC